jgi:hypothetical protein
VWKDQLGATGWGNASHITRLLTPATTYYLVQCCCKISLPLISITKLLLSATRLTRFTTHARGLLYFTNYHIHSYGGFRLYNKILDESKQHTGKVFIGQRAVHIDREHQQNKLDKSPSKKTESNKRGRVHEGTVHKDKHIWKNIPTLYISWLQRTQFSRQPSPTSNIKPAT